MDAAEYHRKQEVTKPQELWVNQGNGGYRNRPIETNTGSGEE